MSKLLPYLKLAVDKNGSDLFFSVGAPPMLKIEGVMMAVGKILLTPQTLGELVDDAVTPQQREKLSRDLELDLALHVGTLGRFRVNLFHQRGHVGMVLRHVKADIPTLDDVAAPEVLKSLSLLKRGLILVVGATGSGKSTTLAAMIRHRNHSGGGHILTVEDPIEFLHPNHQCIVNQREVGQDTASFERALASALREAPDIVMVGEIRTREVMDACVQLANTGHLALSSLHANNAAQALQRVVNLYPADRRQQLYLDLSLTLRAIVSQRLVRTKDGRRCAAYEVLINTPFVQELILTQRIDEIQNVMDQSSSNGMQTFDQSLHELWKSGKVELAEALDNADSRSNLESRIAFGG